jgi:5'-nucleotidase
LKLLLTNDDGYDAEGLQRLAQILSQDHECYVVAPDQCRSCCGHSVTNASELHVEHLGQSQWKVSGTPADCVRIGLVVMGLKPDWVLSGVNHGGNMGIDTLYSGTVAAAREAAILGCRSIALSQYMRRDVAKDWNKTALRAHRVLRELWDQPTGSRQFWNVNLPALEPDDDQEFPITHCPLELGALPISFAPANRELEHPTSRHLYQSNYQMRPKQEGTDVHYCFSGHAVVTALSAFG